MRCFSKCTTHFTQQLRTRTLGHHLQRVGTIFDRCCKWETNNVEQNRDSRIALLAHQAALQRLQATRFKRYWEQEAILRKCSEEKARLVKHCQELEAALHKLSEEKAVLLGQCQDKASLLNKCKKADYETFEHPYRLDSTWLDHWNDRQIWRSIDEQPLSPVLQEKQARQKLVTILQVRGFLRFIVGKAVRDGIIKVSPWGNTQNGLEELGQTREFTTILQQEVKARGLDIDWVMECFQAIYVMLSYPTFWEGGPLIVSDHLFHDSYRAILITLCKVQDNWSYPINWKEETSCKKRR
ncbi:hypothetical protein B9Z19DRAFT_1068943 [Tuber borchii]|uniref:Uncharacterized protein n=1 Tax=Tuber borchii TaxID=42251 RepID=A0A2T6ZDC3_TUBBO|nr:hypothetical protein B9Z19DRAFT_1068943 [Tuber borchii]